MKARWTITLLILAMALTWPAAGLRAATKATDLRPIRVLIVDGHSNHDWKRTTALVRAILEPTGLFDVTVSTAPDKVDDPAYAGWCPDFGKYDVVIQNYNDMGGGAIWPKPAQLAFERFVRDGGGVFILHSANNAFPDWEEYNKIIGLGWRKKDYGYAIEVGPDGSLQRIPPGQGAGTSHGNRTDRVIHRLGDDPIHAGMPRTWMSPQIEVYTYARGPAENLNVLSWAADPATQVGWPIEWTVRYGKGRVFISTFGHVWRDEVDPIDMRDAGFQTILVRSLQWLAKRPVTYPIPADFPTDAKPVLRPLPVLKG